MARKEQGKKKRWRIRRDSQVQILSGEYIGRVGKVTRLIRDNDRVEVEIDGLDEEEKIKKHQKRSNEHPNGAILKLNPTIHISNVMKLDRWNDRPNRKDASAE
ncbi:MAG: KOW motif-containing protein [Verrucomicrobiota bacterium]|jgi:large subunit ribosomal protein L24|nr:KOW motif-containing protein [Verrucomicrobiota bacterium]